MNKRNKLPILLWIIPSIMLFLALGKLPYGYYTLLRIVICFVSVFLCIYEYAGHKKINIFVIIFGVFSIIYNPLIPVHLGSSVWTPVNIITALFLIVHLMISFSAEQNKKESSKEEE